MANYMAVSRTNYFQVTDEKKYEALFGNLASEDNIHDFSFTKDGKTYHGFGSYGGIEFCTDPDGEDSDIVGIEAFAEKLKEILPENEAFIYQEIGNEKLRYIVAYSVIATREEVKFVNLDNETITCARKLLNNPKWNTTLSY